MQLRLYLLISLLSGLCRISYAQTDSPFLAKATQSLSEYSADNPTEKVYLHLDRPYYYPGDTIWFKAYTVAGTHHKLSALSGVLYCELINENDSVVVRRVLKMAAGITWGDFSVSRAWKPGNYHIRAYTNWMRNAGPAWFFNQRVRIMGALSVVSPKGGQTTAKKPDVQFFPEGGGLVNGLRSRVAIKCVGLNGLGQDLSGVVVDNDGNEVATFATQHLGMGVFALSPQQGKSYKAHIVTADSLKMTFDLPAALDKGFVLTVNNSDPDTAYVHVAANDQLFHDSQNAMFYLVAQSAGQVYFTTQFKLSASSFTISVPKKRFPTGIAQFTLFSGAGEPLNERIAFINADDSLHIKLSSPAAAYTARQKVKIDIDTKKDSLVNIASLSAAVVNESRLPGNENDESTIVNNLLLTSDLKGYIEQPNYYFTEASNQKRADLDVLMLTQGYRRFEWKQVLSSARPKLAYQAEQDLELEGSLKTPSGTPLPNGKVTLLATSTGLITDTTTDVNGIFRFTGLDLPDTGKIVIRARKQHNGSNVAIYVKQTDYPAVVKDHTPDLYPANNLSPAMLKNITEYREQRRQDSLKARTQLSGVTITAKKQFKPDIFNGYGTALERNLDMSLARNYATLGEAIRALMPGYRGGSFVLDGLVVVGPFPAYSWDEIQSVRVIDPNGYDPILGKVNQFGYVVVTTKRYAGTDTTVLKEVVIKAKKINPAPDMSRSSNLHGGGDADQVIMGDKMGDCINVSDCLNGRVMGVKFSLNGTPINNRNGAPMSIIVDGLILPPGSLNDLNKDDIYSIEVLRSGIARSIYGSSIAGGGALVVTTRREADPKYVTSQTPAGLITYPFQGYHKARVFYSPRYDRPKAENDPPDTRTTIYWSPNIITDKNGKASFEYYNADTKGTYRVVVEGIDDQGRIGSQVYRYKVE
ncbi:MAG: hypothetical protein JST19_18860 [Bacteroidetes bacterium]|nr:hypothetical protein [Bacteroidota bacterium]